MLNVLFLSIDKQFIGFNQYSSTGKSPPVLFIISITLTIIYAFLLLISLFALWATIQTSLTILRLYIGTMVLISLGELACGIISIVYMKQMPTKLLNLMSDNLRSNYTGLNERQFDRSVDWVQTTYECCGVSSYADYRNGYFYNRQNQLYFGQSFRQIPSSCCKIRNQIHLLDQCQISLQNYYAKGCYDILMIWLDKYGSIQASLSIILSFFHFLLALYVLKQLKPLVKKKFTRKDNNLKLGMKNRIQKQLYGSKYTLEETMSNLESQH